MRILIVSVSTPAHQAGGVERHVVLLTRALQKLGHEVDWLSTPLRGGAAAEAPPGVAFHRVSSGRPASHGPRWWSGSRRLFRGLAAERGYGAVISEAMSAAGLLGLPGLPPLYMFMHGFEPEHWANRWQVARGLRGLLRFAFIEAPETLALTLLEAAMARSSRRIFATGPHIARRARRCYLLGEDRASFFPNWIELEDYRGGSELRRRMRAELELGDDEFAFLFVGALNRQKGADTALRAFDEHAFRFKNTRLIFVGEGEELGALKRDTARFGRVSRVSFLGRRAPAAVAGILAGVDAFLMPTRRIEGLPYVLLEAGASGLPCVATRKGGNEAVLADCAVWVRPGDAQGLARAMDDFAREPAKARELGAATRRRVEREFGEPAALARLREIFA